MSNAESGSQSRPLSGVAGAEARPRARHHDVPRGPTRRGGRVHYTAAQQAAITGAAIARTSATATSAEGRRQFEEQFTGKPPV
jgi:hypothetical protein